MLIWCPSITTSLQNSIIALMDTVGFTFSLFYLSCSSCFLIFLQHIENISDFMETGLIKLILLKTFLFAWFCVVILLKV